MSRHILYIDDVPDHLVLMQHFIERHLPGVLVDTCESVGGAEEKLAGNCYDLVITDINLRGELGTRVAEQILQADPGQPVLIISEYVGEAVQKQLAKLERDYGVPSLRKFSGTSPSAMLDTITSLVNRRPCARGRIGEEHPEFCRFKTCVRLENGKDLEPQTLRGVRLALKQALISSDDRHAINPL